MLPSRAAAQAQLHPQCLPKRLQPRLAGQLEHVPACCMHPSYGDGGTPELSRSQEIRSRPDEERQVLF
jgi:hypothetical protein